MNRALIIYHSRRGTTAAYSEEIAAKLLKSGIETRIMPMYKVAEASLDGIDTLFIGCWTSGLMFFLQKPEKIWVQYLKQMPDTGNREIVLFTTYKLLTGSMFREMAKHLPENSRVSMVRLKSRNGQLTEANRQLLQLLVNNRQVLPSEPGNPHITSGPVHELQHSGQLS